MKPIKGFIFTLRLFITKQKMNFADRLVWKFVKNLVNRQTSTRYFNTVKHGNGGLTNGGLRKMAVSV